MCVCVCGGGPYLPRASSPWHSMASGYGRGQRLLRAKLDHSRAGGGSPAGAGPGMFCRGDGQGGRGILSCSGGEMTLSTIMGSAFCLVGPPISVPHSVSQTGYPAS